MRPHGYLLPEMPAAAMLLLALLPQVVLSLRLNEVSVPAVVMKEDPVWLNCTYEFDRGPEESIYSIKWYKNSVEFYRYIPQDYPPAQKYELDGIQIDLSKSKEGIIYMPTTDVDSEGMYMCEVSSEAPYFQRLYAEKEMRIYVNPRTKPQISGIKSSYGIHELVNLTCKCGPSRPVAFLKWLINGKEVQARSSQLYRPPPVEFPAGMFTSTLVLSFPASPENFFENKVRVQCEAFISQAHTLRSEEITITNSSKPPPATVSHIDSIKDGPSISGGKRDYQVGDTVDVNCTAAKSQPPAELHWYINDKEARAEFVIPLPSITYSGDQESTVLGLRFSVKARHFQKGKMRLRCTATLSEVKKMTSEPLEVEIAEQQRSDLHVDQVNAESVQSCCRNQCWSLETLVSLLLVVIIWSSL